MAKVYDRDVLVIALTRITHAWSCEAHGPAQDHGSRGWAANGVVHEDSRFDHRIFCEVRFTEDRHELPANWCQLEHHSPFDEGRAPEERRLTLDISLSDPSGTLRQAVREAMRDAAVSGLAFRHFAVSLQRANDAAAALRMLGKIGQGPRVPIREFSCQSQISLPQSPTWARLDEWETN